MSFIQRLISSFRSVPPVAPPVNPVAALDEAIAETRAFCRSLAVEREALSEDSHASRNDIDKRALHVSNFLACLEYAKATSSRTVDLSYNHTSYVFPEDIEMDRMEAQMQGRTYVSEADRAEAEYRSALWGMTRAILLLKKAGYVVETTFRHTYDEPDEMPDLFEGEEDEPLSL